MAVITGDEFDNTYGGTDNRDTIHGGLGNDSISGGRGLDYIYGDGGDDDLAGGGGATVLSYEWMFGGTGADTITITAPGAGGHGDQGADLLYGGKNYTGTVLFGDAGDDLLAHVETAYGGIGNDTIRNVWSSGTFAGEAYGDDGDDVIRNAENAPYSNYADGGTGNDTISGFSRAFGGEGNDVVRLNSDSGWCWGDAGDDTIYGGDGDDELLGWDGRDRIYGNNDNDSISGGTGSDILQGNDGDDSLFGNGGKDTLVSGNGADMLEGGLGRDRFVFRTVGETGLGAMQDKITDFNGAAGDRIDLHAIAPGLHFITTAFTGAAGEVRFDAALKQVQIDLGGDGVADGSVKLFTADFDVGDLILA